AAGIAFSRALASSDRPHPERPARASLAAVVAYIAAMLISSAAGRGLVGRAAREAGVPAGRKMISPVPMDHFLRLVVLVFPAGYRLVVLRWVYRERLALDRGT